MPGSRTDCLYRLIFREVSKLWERMCSGDPKKGTPPDRLRIEEWCGADWEAAQCLDHVRRVSTFGHEGLQPQDREEEAVAECGEAGGVFWQGGLVRFHVAGDRKRVTLECVIGPLGGRWMVLRVSGEGPRARL